MNFGAAEIAYENSGIIESQLIRIIENTIDIDFLLQCKGIQNSICIICLQTQYYIIIILNNTFATAIYRKYSFPNSLENQMHSQTQTHLTVRGQNQYHIDAMYQNCLSLLMNYPILDKQPQFLVDQSHQKLLETVSTVEGVTNLMRLLRKKPVRIRKCLNKKKDEEGVEKLPNIIFCRPVKMLNKDQKIFYVLRNQQKKKLPLDHPIGVLVLPKDYLLTVQRKYINLYEIQDDLSISLKHFDSTGIGKRISVVDIKYINYNHKEYVIIFKNEKQKKVLMFQALIYEIIKGKLRFIKKSHIYETQIVSPIIFFEELTTNKGFSKFCLILGGKDSTGTPIHKALQVNLHVFLDDFLTYDSSCTSIIEFKRNVNIFSGKAIKHDHKWYSLCRSEQTINEIILHYQGNGTLSQVDIKDQKLNFGKKFYFSQDSVKLVYDGDEEKMIFFDNDLKLTYKSFYKIISEFSN